VTAGSQVQVLVQRLDTDLEPMAYARAGDAGLDLRARTAFSLAPGARALVPTGVAVALPPGYVGLVHPRSGLALKAGVTVLNAPGTIDASYRGEISVIMINTDATATFHGSRGDRIAQLVIVPCIEAALVEVSELPGTSRSVQGFGSTGA
jgi:dUTP pyrophosphatase